MSTPVSSSQHFITLGQVQQFLGAIAVGITITIALGLTYLFLPRAVASARLTFAERRARVAEGALSDVSAGLEALTSQVAALRADVAQTRTDAAEARAEALTTRKTLIVAFRHIAQLLTFIKSRRPIAEMPALPPEISDGVLDQLRAHELETEAGVQGAVGVVAAVTP